MAVFNVHEAKTQFSRLLERVLHGEEVLITRNGVPVASWCPPASGRSRCEDVAIRT